MPSVGQDRCGSSGGEDEQRGVAILAWAWLQFVHSEPSSGASSVTERPRQCPEKSPLDRWLTRPAPDGSERRPARLGRRGECRRGDVAVPDQGRRGVQHAGQLEHAVIGHDPTQIPAADQLPGHQQPLPLAVAGAVPCAAWRKRSCQSCALRSPGSRAFGINLDLGENPGPLRGRCCRRHARRRRTRGEAAEPGSSPAATSVWRVLDARWPRPEKCRVASSHRRPLRFARIAQSTRSSA
jgi:hypothetical protein